MDRASRNFFARDTIEVAYDLLGSVIEYHPPGESVRRACVVETEAYLGHQDPACHTFDHRRTPRVETMYGQPGLAYVYLIYGMYHCLNVVTASTDVAEAVLIRAAEPIDGFDDADPRALAGPGKLCRAFGFTRAHDGIDLVTSGLLFITPRVSTPRAKVVEVVSGPRVGLADRHDAVHWPLRYGVRASRALSNPRFPPSDLDLAPANLRLKVPKEVRDEDL